MAPGTARPGPASQATAGVVLLALCFFLSGFGSLALEVVWTRQLRLVFGSTTLAASTILVAYMLGLGLGGLAGGRVAGRVRDGVRAYGWMEVTIGLYALAVPSLLAIFPVVNREILHGLSFWPAALVRFVLALALFLLPTLVMGATLPVVVAALVRRDPRIAATTGLLYGVNTLGAVAGVFVATFVLFPTLGIWRTNAAGAAVAMSVGLIAALVVPRVLRAPPPLAADASPDDVTRADAARRARDALDVGTVSPRLLLVAYAGVGFAALVCEVGWMRGLAIVLGSSIYGFAAMLGAFLSGIALGSLLLRGVVERTRRPLLLLGFGLVAFAALSLATTLSLPLLPRAFLRVLLWSGSADAPLVPAQIAICLLVMLPPTLVLGALFPLLARIVAASAGGDAGRAVGRVYFANTVGSAAGAFAAGFVLLPGVGLERTLALASALALALAAPFLFVAAPRARRMARAAAASAVAVAALLLAVPLPFDRVQLTRGVFHQPDAHLDFGIEMLPLAGEAVPSLLYYRDGINATISVHRLGGVRALKVNGKVDASDGGDMPNQVLPAHVALLFGPPARDVLVIGYASGVTVGSVVRHDGVERVDTVEIEPAVIEAAAFFDEVSGAPLEDPRVRLVLDDGRTWLETTRDRYDVIVSQPSNPWMTGVANLFTREFFRAASRALRPDGRLLQWMQLYGMDPEGLAAIIAAMRTEFPYIYGFAGQGEGANVLLLAMRRPLGRDDLPRWRTLPPAVQDDLRRVGVFSTADLWSLLRSLPADIDALARQASAINSDENLMIELRAPLMSNRVRVGENWAALAPSPDGVASLLRDLGEPLDHEALGALAYAYGQNRGDYTVAQNLMRLAGEQGRAGNAIAAAVALVRALDEADSVSLDDQLASLDEAVELAPDGTAPALLRGVVRQESERPDLALEDAERVLAKLPGDPRARALRMRALAALERWDEAAAEASLLLGSSAAAGDDDLLKEVAATLALAENDAAALPLLERLLRFHDPSWEGGGDVLATVYARGGRPRDAAAARYNVEVARRNRSRSLHRMARLALWSGDRRSARTLLELAVAFDPEYGPAGDDLADLEERHASR
jgi:spermidine synthase